VQVETLLPTGPVHLDNLKVIGETQQLVGGGSYIDLERANRILQERNLISGAMIKVERGQAVFVEGEINKLLGVASVINFAERQREMAALRVMGFSIQELSSLMLKENILQVSLGIILGLPFGRSWG
jgi:putative ABC transport system permease protein